MAGPPIPDLGQTYSEGGDAGYGAATAPSRPTLVTGAGSSQRTMNILEMRY